MDITLVRIHKENHNVRTFWFRPDKRFRYTAGQFIELHLPHEDPDERGQKHWFTLSSSPTEELVAITTKHAGAAGSTFKNQMFGLKPGSKVEIVEPMGDFVLPKDASIPLVFVAGGMGITPYRSMVKWLIDRGEKRDIQLLIAVKSPQDAIFLDVFRIYGLDPTILPSQPSSNWQGQSGRLTARRIVDFAKGVEGKRIYVSGPEPMVESLEKDLYKLGVGKTHLVNDYFPGYQSDLA